MVEERNHLVVASSEAGTRLDRWLTLKDPSLGRKRAKDLCDAGKVLVDGRPASKSLPLVASSTVSFPASTPKQAVANSSLGLDIRFESEHCVVVHKNAGQPTAPLNGLESETLANAILGHFPTMRNVGANPLEPGLIHRLDNGTSGLLIAAKTQPAFEALRAALTQGEIVKEYLAVVVDHHLPEAGRIDTPLAPSPHNASKVAVVRSGSRNARPAVTTYQVLTRCTPLALVRAEAKRALRHQIRAHFASIGCPLANDVTYGSPRVTELAPQRHALHAERVAWNGNPEISGFDVIAELPTELRSWIEHLGFDLSRLNRHRGGNWEG